MVVCAPRLTRSRREITSLRSALQRIEPLVQERRDERRTAFPYDLRLTPLDRGAVAAASPIVVVGRDLSMVGIGFEHAEPLPYRRARLVAADPRLCGLGLATLEIDVLLRWCRFVEPGRYESGGRILRSTTHDLVA
ncbi:MAG: hypothetical protein AAF266_00825 [Planctomycetota bacterium]